MGSLSNSVASANSSNAMPASPSLEPTWTGYVSDTKDSLILFEAAIGGKLRRVVRRPHDRERANLIKSGSVFIYEESASGIKRWTDGVPWSPSRILNNFLIYRELEKPFPPGEKKRATKKIKRDPRPGELYTPSLGQDEISGSNSPPIPLPQNSPALSLSATPMKQQDSGVDRDQERNLVGSLTDSYQFKAGGLVKKTMSVRVDEVSYHLVSYYTPEDVKSGRLPRPSAATDLQLVEIRPELLHRQNFRAPLEEQIDDPAQNPYRNRSQSHLGSPPTFFPGHPYSQAPPIPSTGSYYNNNNNNLLPTPFHMSQPSMQQPQYVTSSRGPMAPPSVDAYYQTNPGGSVKREYDQYSSYAEQQQFNPRNYYPNSTMNAWHDPHA